MQNVQNAAEIQQRVINLVELYRTKMGKESQIAKDAKVEKKYWDDVNLDAAFHLHEEGFKSPIGIDMAPDMPEEWVNTLRVNDHLLGHFYSVVAGDDADKDVLSQFLADYYDPSIYTPEEEEFLRSHFKEMVNYIIQTPCDDLYNVNHHDSKDWQLIPTEVLELIKSRTHIPAGSTIYNPFSGFAQMASLYSDCKFCCEDSYASYNKRWNAFSEKCQKEYNVVPGTRDVSLMAAWMKLALYANSIDARVIEDGTVPAKYDSVISFIPRIPNAIPVQAYELDFELPDDPEIVNKIIVSYKNLPEGGNMILVLPKEYLWSSNSYYSLRPLWEEMIKDESLTEIIQLPWVMSTNLHREDFCIVIAEKGRDGRSTTFVDARFAVQKSERKNFNKILDLKMLEDMFANGGKDSETGLRKMVQVNVEELKSEILVPQIYVVERPFDAECPVPLSTLGTLVSTRIRSLQFDLPEDTPWVEQEDLSNSFKGELDVASIKKAECPNNPLFVEGSEDYAFSKSGKFVDDFWEQAYTKKGHKVYDYRRCTYLDGTKDAVLFSLSQQGMEIGIVRATGKAVAVGEGIRVICPKDGVDVITLAALLKLPIVIRQLQAYKDFGLANHLDDILIPSDKRIIHDEITSLLLEGDTISELEKKLVNQKKSVRMRKHALTQSLSSIEAMFNALNNFRIRKGGVINDGDVISRITETTVNEAYEFISKGIKDLMPALEHIADIEYTFSKPEWIDPELFVEDYIARKEKEWLNFKPIITWEKGHNQAKKDYRNLPNGDILLKKGESFKKFSFPKDALEHVFKNIISNAQAWAFDDQSREDYQLKFSWRMDGKSLIVEIANNGTPIPKDRDTTSLLKYGVSAALHHNGHNGIGCNEVDDIMQRYNGNVEIISTPDEIFTVKYILTFYHSINYGELLI